jgi:hypothetical protein
MNQKSLVVVVVVVAAMFALMATIALVPQAFAQNVTSGGIDEDDDTTNISSTPTKVKDAANCNIGGFANECDNESEAEE